MTSSTKSRGHALIGTMIFLVLGMLLWAAVFQQSSGHLRVERALNVRTDDADRLRRATAWGLSLLETGEPPLDSGRRYACRMVLDGQVYLVTYQRNLWFPIYQVRAERKEPSFEDYPLAPNSFGQ